jgi:hypothetical protein
MGVIRLIRDVARLLAGDLQTAGRGFSGEVVPESPLGPFPKQIAAALSLHIPEVIPESISIRCNGEEHLRLVFDGERDFSTQLAEGLDQVQDFVAETTTEQWPPCRDHRHAMRPIADRRLASWSCPISAGRPLPLGRLSNRPE